MSISQLAYDCIKRELGIMVEKIATLQSQLAASQERELEMHGMKSEIAELRAKLTLAEKKLELATVGLGMIRELDRIDEGVAPKEVSDYEQGMGSGFEIAAEIATATLKAAEEVKGCTGK